MKYLLLVSHASLARGIEEALNMLLGPRDFVIACGMEEGTSPADFQASLAAKLADVSDKDEVVLLADIAGGSPHKTAMVALGEAGLGERTYAFGGANLPMAISAVMGIEDDLDLDAIRDAMLVDGAQAVRQL